MLGVVFLPLLLCVNNFGIGDSLLNSKNYLKQVDFLLNGVRIWLSRIDRIPTCREEFSWMADILEMLT
jgi:hypothetical protein